MSINGSYFEVIRAKGGGKKRYAGPDPFAVLGMHATEKVTLRGLRRIKQAALKHAFERLDIMALTQGSHVPTWNQINEAGDKLLHRTEAEKENIRKFWVAQGSVPV